MRITASQLHRIIRESIRVAAGSSYMREYEDPMSAVQGMLSDYLRNIPREEVKSMAPGAPELVQEIEHALDELGITDPAKRELIARPLRMVPPIALLAPSPVR